MLYVLYFRLHTPHLILNAITLAHSTAIKLNAILVVLKRIWSTYEPPEMVVRQGNNRGVTQRVNGYTYIYFQCGTCVTYTAASGCLWTSA